MKNTTHIRRWLTIGFAVVVVGIIVFTIVSNWADFSRSVTSMNAGWLAVSSVLGIGGVVFSMLSWRSAVGAFGYPVPVASAARIVFISQIGKYLPGGVWPIVVGTRLGLASGVPAGVMAISLTSQLVVSVVAGGTLSVGALLAFPVLSDRFGWLIIIALVIGVVALIPPVLQRLIALALRLLRRGTPAPRVGARGLAMSVCWSLVSWVAFGLHLWTILRSLGSASAADIALSISGYALAWVVGFLIVIAPAGGGVREIILALVLGTVVPADSLIGIVLVSRFILIGVDILLCLLALGASRRILRRTAPSATG